MIYVLLGASVVTALLGHWVDTGVIIGVVVINALIGFLQEGKAERGADYRVTCEPWIKDFIRISNRLRSGHR